MPAAVKPIIVMAFLETAVNGSLPAGGGPSLSLPVLVPFNATTEAAASSTSASLLTTVVSTTLPQPSAWTAGLVSEYVIRLVIAVLMVLINLLVLVTLGTTPSLRCATNWVIGSLAVTDLMVGVVSPGGLLIELQVLVSPLLCRAGYAGMIALSSVSINHLLFVSVDRYLLISRPLRHHAIITKRRVWLFIAGCWLWALAISLPFMLGLTIAPNWDGRCLAELMIPAWFLITLFLLHFLLPLIVMMYVHAAIFAVARRQQKAVKNSLHPVNGERIDPTRGRENSSSSTSSSSPSSAFNRAKLRAARLLVLPCGYFYLSWGPWFLLILWAVLDGKVVEPHELERFVQTLAVLNSLGNPVLYSVSQPLLGRAMVARVVAIGKTCKSSCCFSTFSEQQVEATTLVTPDKIECTNV